MNDYYAQQAGSGMAAYSGVRYQRGNGFMGRLWKSGFMPIIKKVLPYIGRKALSTGIDIMDDVADGQTLKGSVKKRIKETGDTVANDTIMKVKQMTGTGRKRKRTQRKRIRCNMKKKSVKRRVVKRSKKRRTNTTAKDFL